MDAQMMPAQPGAPVEAEPVDPSDARKALVKEWLDKIKAGKEHQPTKKAFERMKRNMEFASRGADKEWIEADKYVVPIINRHINQSVSQLYAKNPTAVAKRRRSLDYSLWDGRPDSLKSAMEMAPMGDPNAAAIIQEVLAVQQKHLMLTRLGKTMEALWTYFLGEQVYNYKQQLKAMVRRAKVCGVAYIKVGFQRLLEPHPEVTARINDVTSKLAAIESNLKGISEGKIDESSPRMEELKTLLADLQGQQMLIAREGPIFDFPRATEVIIDPACRHLKSLAGARWVAQEYELTADEIFDVYKVDVKDSATPYRTDGHVYSVKPSSGERVVFRVYEVQDQRNQQCLTVVEGHDDFLKEPYQPTVEVDRFWTIFPLVFNEIEHDEEIYPPSDVEQARHIQLEYNRSREGLREHRIAARPYYVEGGRMEEDEKKKLANHNAHDIITTPSLGDGQKIEDVLQRGPTAPIDPNLYEVEMHFQDLLRTVGTQEANLGGVGGGTATESSIAEQSRSSSLADNVDDLDELLTDVAKAFSQVCFLNLSKETVVEIVGDGAVWPDLQASREAVAKDLLLEIKAGSSGRPNKAADLANLERGIPLLMQTPGVNPQPLVTRYAELLDLDLEEIEAEGMPSITAMNAMMAKMGAQPPMAGDPQSDPAAQGAAGAQNAPNPQASAPAGQPGYPAPMPGA